MSTLTVFNYFTKKSVELHIMNFDMIDVKCDVKIIPNDSKLNSWSGLAAGYLKHVEGDEYNSDKYDYRK